LICVIDEKEETAMRVKWTEGVGRILFICLLYLIIRDSLKNGLETGQILQ